MMRLTLLISNTSLKPGKCKQHDLFKFPARQKQGVGENKRDLFPPTPVTPFEYIIAQI